MTGNHALTRIADTIRTLGKALYRPNDRGYIERVIDKAITNLIEAKRTIRQDD